MVLWICLRDMDHLACNVDFRRGGKRNETVHQIHTFRRRRSFC